MKAREAVFVSLQKYETGSKYLNIEADAAIRRNALQGADRALYTALLYGTVERRITLDYILSLLSDRPLEQIDPNIRRILRLSLYQLCYMDRIPAYAVLYDAGALTRRFARNDAVPFVNAVLRAYLRRKATLPFPKQTEDPIQYLSITYAYPAWLCDLFVRQYGLSRTEKILHGFSVPPTLTLFTNTQRLSREELLRRLMQDGIDAIPTTYSPYGVRLREHVPLSEISPLQQGLCFVQDEASQIAACALGALPGDTVLDACACPGVKSFATALCMQNRGTLIACDLHENKLALVQRGAQALGLDCIQTQQRDSGVPDTALLQAFDRVLCDVPCSGLGVLSKKPDIRDKDPTSIARLPNVQKRILDACAPYVKPGGTLLYATCTLNAAENEEQIQAFLQRNPLFQKDSFSIGTRLCNGYATLLPDEMPGLDGFYIAKLRRMQ